jgi:hypothetical protein
MMTDPEKKLTDIKQPNPEQSEPKKFSSAHRTYESMTNQEYMAVHKSLMDIQQKLSHPEFGFARYLLEMAIQEFISPGSDNDPLSGSEHDAGHKYDIC